MDGVRLADLHLHRRARVFLVREGVLRGRQARRPWLRPPPDVQEPGLRQALRGPRPPFALAPSALRRCTRSASETERCSGCLPRLKSRSACGGCGAVAAAVPRLRWSQSISDARRSPGAHAGGARGQRDWLGTETVTGAGADGGGDERAPGDDWLLRNAAPRHLDEAGPHPADRRV